MSSDREQLMLIGKLIFMSASCWAWLYH